MNQNYEITNGKACYRTSSLIARTETSQASVPKITNGEDKDAYTSRN